ncbi:dTMP kinase [Miniphocaeibacter halophilus]|uniref:dTMP kinase n=1 Tax=Miniphocaeibacter halophilus TaxID=2931922 RepID=A0AC61MPC2_9FIRM|nr:dTMP kinase [Miniphocaeibacter halophilus]QQK07326.1 dTMP kinase [Miniphocaeibacter halophilus]
MFITFEGPDGSGKTTIINMVYNSLVEKGYKIIKTREPGGTAISEKLRDIILDKNNKELTYRTEALLYAASRAQLVEEVIYPNLQKGNIILSDRYVLSSLAYQGAGRKLGIKEIFEINKFATNNLNPDLVLFFKVDPITTLKRKNALFEADRMELEDENFHSRVYKGYMDIFEKYHENDNFVEIDATKSIEEVFSNCLNIILERIRRK